MTNDQEDYSSDNTNSPQGWHYSGVNSPCPTFFHFPPLNHTSSYSETYPTTSNDFMYPDQERSFLNRNSKMRKDKWITVKDNTFRREELYRFNTAMTYDKPHDMSPANTYNALKEVSFDFKEDILKEGDYDTVNTISNAIAGNDFSVHNTGHERKILPSLSLNVTERASWLGDTMSTPDVVDFVTQLDTEEHHWTNKARLPWSLPQRPVTNLLETPPTTPSTDFGLLPSKIESLPELEDENNEYERSNTHSNCYSDNPVLHSNMVNQSSRKYSRRKPRNIRIKDLIEFLQQAQPTNNEKPKRGRPPNTVRRGSEVSANSSDESNFNIDIKYRQLRDKNNEASKRSRQNRKLKELQLEQLAAELEERNKKLKVRVSVIEDTIKVVKDALVAAIHTKKEP